ncbi:MAG: hypothetical protein J1E83_01305 [Lachnospiraceae bacterium]|nr:hypothetical protein [Lachnospiraceae bacterium]
MGKDIGLKGDEILNSRFYGVAGVRGRQLVGLRDDIARKTHQNWQVGNQTVDALNMALGLSFNTMSQKQSMGIVREYVEGAVNSINRTAPEEVQAWSAWLKEPSRWNALMMYEMNGDECRRERCLDKALKNPAYCVPTTKERNLKIAYIDMPGKRIYAGDENRYDNRVNWINSGLTFTLYWMQEGRGTDDNKNKRGIDGEWTDGMKAAHNQVIDAPNVNTITEGYNKLRQESAVYYGNPEAFNQLVSNETRHWQQFSPPYRFFRLTSLMGMDFFVNRGNMVRFARNENQPNYTGHAVNRVITDSEWAHAEEMGYLAEGRVIRHDNDDSFHLV